MFAKLTIVARMGAEAKVIPTSNGNSFVTFSMVVNRWLGEGKEPATEWFDFKAFQKNAEKISKAPKGAELIVEATPTIEKWTDKTTSKENKKVVFLVDRVIVRGGSEATGSSTSKPTATSKPTEEPLEDPFADEDPFA